MKKKIFTLTGFIALSLMIALPAMAAPVTYYNLNFEDGSLGGGVALPSFPLPTNISSSNLDGKALFFELDSQIVWNLNGPDSATQLVAFDYYAEAGANVTQFLDIPSILRLDVSAEGRHHVAVYYNLSAQTAASYLDGVLDPSLMIILAWPSDSTTLSIRIVNQTVAPGNSTNVFEIDNLLWQGNAPSPVPEPATMLLLGTGLVGLWGARRKLKK